MDDFFMPSADVLAEERAREAVVRAREEKLLAEINARYDKEQAERDARHEEMNAKIDALFQQDEADEAARLAARWYEPTAAGLMPALAATLPASARPLLLRSDFPACLPHLVSHLSPMLMAGVRWDEDGSPLFDGDALDDDVVYSVGALLAATLLAHDSTVRLQATGALHTLLDYRATRAQADELGRLLIRGLEDVRARIELSDALRSIEGTGSNRLATRLRDTALLELLGVPAEQMPAEHVPTDTLVQAMRASWEHLEPANGNRVALLMGRRMAMADADERSRLLAEVRRNRSQALKTGNYVLVLHSMFQDVPKVLY